MALATDSTGDKQLRYIIFLQKKQTRRLPSQKPLYRQTAPVATLTVRQDPEWLRSPLLRVDWSQIWKMLQRQAWEVPTVERRVLPGGRSAQLSKALSQLPFRWEVLPSEPLAQTQHQNLEISGPTWAGWSGTEGWQRDLSYSSERSSPPSENCRGVRNSWAIGSV